ncbi:hypothetical protein HPB52_018579 [Rhipicephalus sanguineus]|uniref:Reprolysin n=1 Tax=Rhipicephalus sanguineus TaxID=34632 RepID=A0A9D4PF87_RHISA|nr:hypothetical protein HPB52_018579 [Rhipicephalus sanguineus]
MALNTKGIGYVGGLCTRQFVALGEDSGLYDGMHTLTHEGAHVLGAAHDQSQPNQWIPGDPGSLSCPWSRGNIMSYVDGGINHHRFSDSPDVSKCMVKCQYPEVRQTCRYPPCYTYTTIHSSIVHALDYTTCGKGEEGVVGPYHRIEPMLTMERSEEGLIPHMIHEIEKKEMLDIERAIPEKGIGFVGGLCSEFFVALGEDVAGTYSGMHTMTHEGGHV